jgi:hypothetical protein
VRASVDCGNSCNAFLSNTRILDASVVPNGPGINHLQSKLTNVSSNSPNAPCAGDYDYTMAFKFSPNRIAKLRELIVPVDTSSFRVVGASVGADTLNLMPVVFSFTAGTPTAQNVTNVRLFVDSSITQAWPGLNFQFNQNVGYPTGAWINTNPGVDSFYVRLHLESKFQNACSAPIVRLTRPVQLHNRIQFFMSNTCNNNITPQTFVNLPQVAAPTYTPPTMLVNVPGNPGSGPGVQLPFSLQFALPSVSPFDIHVGNSPAIFCDSVRYRITIRLDSLNSTVSLLNSSINSLIVNGTNMVSNNFSIDTLLQLIIIDLPDSLQQGILNNVSFNLQNIPCPDTVNFFGQLIFNLRFEALCAECTGASEVVRTLRCVNPAVMVHCPGPCDSAFDIEDSVRIVRNTFGWASESAYINNLSPLTDAAAAQAHYDSLGVPSAFAEQQFERFYPYDIFTISAKGKSFVIPNEIHQNFRFEMMYSPSGLGADFFDLLDYHISFIDSVTNNTMIVAGNAASVLSAPPLATVTPTGYLTPMLVREMTLPIDSLIAQGIQLDSNKYFIHFSARFRITSTADLVAPGDYPNYFQCQFRSHSINPITQDSTDNFSCDPYGASILVLIPDVELVQNSVQSGAVFLPAGATDSIPGVLVNVPESSCRFGHALGIKHTGGLGNTPDFPFEFRPISSWPTQLASPNLVAAGGFYNGTVINYTQGPGGEFSNNAQALLPAMSRDVQINPSYHGLVLTLSKECPNSNDSIDFPHEAIVPSLVDFEINPYAYIHSGHLLGFSPAVVTGSAIASVPDNAVCNGMVLLPMQQDTVYLANGTSVFSFGLTAPASANGLPFALQITSADTNATLGLFSSGVNHTPVGGGWFIFPDGLPVGATSPNAQIDITLLQNGCYAEAFALNFVWHVFCDTAQLTAFVNNPNGATACLQCSATQHFQRGISSIDNLVIHTSFWEDSCSVFWRLQLVNPDNMPAINLSELTLHFSTGMMHQSSGVAILPGGSVQPTLQLPVFNLVSSNTAPGLTTVQTDLQLDSLLLLPGDTLQYTLRFGLSEGFCNSYTAGNSLLQASLSGSNVCDDPPFSFQPIFIDYTGFVLPNSNCCLPNPFTITQACDSVSGGSILVINHDEDTLTLSLYDFGLGVSMDNTFAFQLYAIDSIAIGDYYLQLFNHNTGAYFTQHVLIEDYGISTGISVLPVTPVCSGTQVVLTSSVSPTASASGVPYTFTYNWLPGNGSVDSLVVNPSVSTNYTVTVSNDMCEATDSVMVSVYPIIVPSIVNSGALNFCDGDSVVLYSLTPGSGYQWLFNGMTITGATDSSLIVYAGGNYSLAMLDTNNCATTSPVTSVTVYSLPTVPVLTSMQAFTFCDGDSIVLYTDGSGINSWSNGAQGDSIVVYQAGVYSSTTTDSLGCSSTSASVDVTVNPLPQAPVVSVNGSLSFCMGDSVVLTSSLVHGNLWSTGDSTQSITVFAGGNYFVSVADSNGCVANSATVSITVFAMPTGPNISTSFQNPACAGGAMVLSSTVAYEYLWSTGDTTQSIVVNTTGIYWVMVTDSNGCVAAGLDTIVVSVSPCNCEADAGPDLEFDPCQPGSIGPACVNGFMSYSWSPALGLNNPFVANPLASPEVVTEYVLTVSYTHPISGMQFFDYDTVLVTPVNNLCLEQYGPVLQGVVFSDTISLGGFSSTTVAIEGHLIVNSNFTISDSEIVMGKDAKITVNSGSLLSIVQSRIHACCFMWDGIILEDGSVVVVNQSSIEDADTAIYGNGDVGCYIRNGVLNKNYYSGYFENNANTLNLQLDNVMISCINSITPVSYGNDNLRKPRTDVRSNVGLFLRDIGMATIGTSTGQNEFNNLDYGIIGFSSSMVVENNHFQHIDGNSLFPVQHSVFAPGTAIGVANLNYGSYTVKVEKNGFKQGNTGIRLYNGINAVILNNQFKDLRNFGLVYENNKTKKLSVYENVSDNIGWVHYYGFNNINSKITVEGNSLNNSGHHGYVTGIAFKDYTLGWFNSVGQLRIRSNTVNNIQFGIDVAHYAEPKIEFNTVNIMHTPWDVYALGIRTEYCKGEEILMNTIYGNQRHEYFTDGIRIDYSNSPSVNCNNTVKTGSGLMFSVSYSNSISKIRNNSMYNNYWGITLAHGSILALHQNGQSLNNRWIGSYAPSTIYSHTYAYDANGLLSPIYTSTTYPFHSYNNSFALLPGTNAVNWIFDSSNGIYDCNFMPIDTTNMLAPASGEAEILEYLLLQELQTQYSAENNWHKATKIYDELYFHDSLATGFVTLEHFKDSVQSGAYGHLVEFGNYYCDTLQLQLNFDSLHVKNNSVQEGNIAEFLMKEMNEFIIEHLQTHLIEDAKILWLREVASLCPISNGPAVINARSILMLYDTMRTIYMNECERVYPSNQNGEDRNYQSDYFEPIEDYMLSKSSLKLSIWPNPANEIVYVQANQNISEISIFDVNGKVILIEHPITKNDFNLYINDISNGIYILRFLIENNTYHYEKLVIHHGD